MWRRREALELRRGLPDQLEFAQSLNNIASIYEVKGRYNLALNYYEQSQTIKLQLAQKGSAEKDLSRSIARAYGNMGICYRYLGNHPKAMENFGQSIKVYEDLKDLNGLTTISNYSGDALASQGLLEQALEQFNKSLAYNPQKTSADLELQAQILNNIGLVHYLNKKYDLALAACQESLRLRESLPNKERIARTQRRLGMIYLALGKPVEALQFAQTAAQGSRQHPETFWQARLVEGEAHLALKNPAEAERSLAEAIKTIEEMRQQAPKTPETQQQFFENKLTPYLAMTDLLVSQARHHEALAFAERTKARVILDLIQAGQATLTKDSRLLTAAPLTSADLASLVPNTETAVMEFVIFNEKIHLFILTKGASQAAEVQMIPLAINTTQLSELVRKFRQEVAERKVSFAIPAAALYQHLLEPAASVFKSKKNLVIVPDGILWELPFQALKSTPNKFLWQDHMIYYAPSLSALREIAKRQADSKPTTRTLLALGNPALPPNEQSSLAPETLTYAERQVRQLRQIYGSNTSKILLGAAATEQAFKTEAAKYSILHLATHGIYDDRSPMSSRILLSPSSGEDGRVEAQEILNLKLTNELIVLSACETGRGRIGPGEGVIGLTWAFLIAGCPTLVASQWEVRDDSTGTLMEGFHRALKNTQQPKAESLRQAALALMKSPQYQHPYYWAGFVLVGDGN